MSSLNHIKYFVEIFNIPVLLTNKLEWKSSNEEFDQIVHICQNHWVCDSIVNYIPNFCNIYDGMSLSYAASLTTQVIAASLLLHFPHSHRMDPIEYSFDQKRMRIHVKLRFEKALIFDFPMCTRPRHHTNPFKSTMKVKVHCCCRLPWTKKPIS